MLYEDSFFLYAFFLWSMHEESYLYPEDLEQPKHPRIEKYLWTDLGSAVEANRLNSAG